MLPEVILMEACHAGSLEVKKLGVFDDAFFAGQAKKAVRRR
jgi:hypothetical protein